MKCDADVLHEIEQGRDEADQRAAEQELHQDIESDFKDLAGKEQQGHAADADNGEDGQKYGCPQDRAPFS